MQAFGAIAMALVLLIGATWSGFDWPSMISSLAVSIIKVLAWAIVAYGAFIFSPSFDGDSASSARALQEQEELSLKKRAEEEMKTAEEAEKNRVDREQEERKRKEVEKRNEENVFRCSVGKPVLYVWERGTTSQSRRVQQNTTEATSGLQTPPTTPAMPQSAAESARKAKGVNFTPDTKSQSVDDPVIAGTGQGTAGVQSVGEDTDAGGSEQKQEQQGGSQSEQVPQMTLNEILDALKPDTTTTVAAIESEENGKKSEEATQASAAEAARQKAEEDQKRQESFRETLGQWRFEPQIQQTPVVWSPDYCQHRHAEVDALYKAFVAQMQSYAPMAQHYGIKVCMHCECCGYGPFGQQGLPFMPHPFLYELQFGSNYPSTSFGNNQPVSGAQDGYIATGTGIDQSQPADVAQPAPQQNPLLSMSINDARSTVKQWMDSIHENATRLRIAVRINSKDFRGASKENEAWKATMKDTRQVAYCSDLVIALKYILEWAAPTLSEERVWDKTRLPADSLDGIFGLQGDRFDKLSSLFEDGCGNGVVLDHAVGQVRAVDSVFTSDSSQYGINGVNDRSGGLANWTWVSKPGRK